MKNTPQLTNKSDWRTYSKIYDAYYGAYRHDIEYLTSCWKPTWHSVMEIGAGTGRLIPFFKSQNVSKYVGIDICPEMLEIAFEKIKLNGYQLIQADLLTHDLDGWFDLFVYAFNTANYLLDSEQLQKHLQICSAHLRNGGNVFLDLYAPFAITKSEDSSTYRLREKVQIADRVLELHDRRTYDPASRIEERQQKSLEMLDGVLQAELHFQTWRRYYLPEEIERMTANAGLRLTHIEEYGISYVEGCYMIIS
jgi:SAM-dependent methyltransferase